MGGIKWRALLGLGLVFTALAFNLRWLFGVIFLLWMLPDIRSGTTHFLEPVSRRQNPFVYWAVIITWVLLSLYLLVEPLLFRYLRTW